MTSLFRIAALAFVCSVAAAAENEVLDLRQVVALSAATSEVDIAAFETGVATAGVAAERWALLPNLDATANASRQRFYPTMEDGMEVDPSTELDAQLRLGWTLLDLEAWHRRKAAQAELRASEAAAILAIERSALTAALAWLGLGTAQAEVDLAVEDLRLAEELLVQAKAKVETGVAEAISETRAASQVETARAALVSAQGRRRSAAIDLARVLELSPGVDLSAARVPDEALIPTLGFADADAAEAYALANRSELKVSDATLAAIEAQARAATGARLPRLGVFAQTGYGGPDTDHLDPGWGAGVGIVIPLVDGSADRADQARLRARQQQRRRDEVEIRVRAQVRTALSALETAQARLVAERARSDLADQELDQARKRFDAGVAGNLEVIDAQRSRTAAQASILQSLLDLSAARVRLIAATGSIRDLTGR